MNAMFTQGDQRGEATRELVELNCYSRWFGWKSGIMAVLAVIILVLAAVTMGKSDGAFTQGFALNWVLIPIGFLAYQAFRVGMAFFYRSRSVHLKDIGMSDLNNQYNLVSVHLLKGSPFEEYCILNKDACYQVVKALASNMPKSAANQSVSSVDIKKE